MSTTKPMFNIATSASTSIHKPNVKVAIRTTIVESAVSIQYAVGTVKRVFEYANNVLDQELLEQRLDGIDNLVTEYGLSNEEAGARKQAILTTFLG